MALPRKYRLTARKDFAGVFKQGETVRHGFFFIKFRPNNLAWARAGVVVSARVSKKAVVRNKIRRIVSQALAKPEILGLSKDLAVIVSPTIVGKRPKEIKSALEQTIKKLSSQLK